MIALLRGKIELKTEKFIILDVGGVGYRIFCSSQTLKELAKKTPDKKIKLFIHLHTREGILDLYGFLTREELEFFEQLISVAGIGPKVGLSVMALASVKTLKQAIASGQKSLLTKVSGIGSKTAERIILELKNKVVALVSEVKQLSSDSDAIDALVSLGYTAGQAREALEKVPSKVKGIGKRVKEALKILGK